ncbi:MAG: hypothetical protein ABIV42_06335 [Nitrosospira sp.]
MSFNMDKKMDRIEFSSWMDKGGLMQQIYAVHLLVNRFMTYSSFWNYGKY